MDVLDAVSRLQGIPVAKLKTVVNTGPKHLHGTWVHEDVALHLAAWLSKDFYAFMLQTFGRYIRGEITTEESKAAKQAVETRQEQDRIKYEQTLQQLTDTRGQERTQRNAYGIVGIGQGQSGGPAGAAEQGQEEGHKKSRAEDKFQFVKRLREAIKLYVEDWTVSSPEGGFKIHLDCTPSHVHRPRILGRLP